MAMFSVNKRSGSLAIHRLLTVHRVLSVSVSVRLMFRVRHNIWLNLLAKI